MRIRCQHINHSLAEQLLADRFGPLAEESGQASGCYLRQYASIAQRYEDFRIGHYRFISFRMGQQNPVSPGLNIGEHALGKRRPANEWQLNQQRFARAESEIAVDIKPMDEIRMDTNLVPLFQDDTDVAGLGAKPICFLTDPVKVLTFEVVQVRGGNELLIAK